MPIFVGVRRGASNENRVVENFHFYQRGSIASYASASAGRGPMSVRLSVRHTPVLYQNEQRHDFFTVGKPEHSSFFENSLFIIKFQRGHPEQGSYLLSFQYFIPSES